jgi:N-acetyl-anhydromuramyl-L-alanine amidase AmpD
MEHPRPSEWRPVLKVGDVGPDVAAWRLILTLERYDLSGARDAFTPSVHNATMAWQRARGLKPDGQVGPATRASLQAPVMRRPPPHFDPAAIPYLEATNWSRNVGPQPKHLIVLHCMEWPETSTGAEWCAGFFAGRQGPAPQTSANYCIDDDTIVCSVPPDRIAWHAPGANKHGIGLEHSGFARQSRAQWLDDYSLRMLMLSAELTAWLCRRFEIPLQFVLGDHLRHGGRGITTHAEVTRAWPDKGSHTDPGPFFPIGEYLRFVVEATARQRAQGALQWSGPCPSGRTSLKRSRSHSMNAAASSVKPSRFSAYSVKAASRIQV